MPTVDDLQSILSKEFEVSASVDSQAPLGDLGLDSLDMASFVFLLEERFGTPVPEGMLDEIDTVTVGELAERLNAANHD